MQTKCDILTGMGFYWNVYESEWSSYKDRLKYIKLCVSEDLSDSGLEENSDDFKKAFKKACAEKAALYTEYMNLLDTPFTEQPLLKFVCKDYLSSNYPDPIIKVSYLPRFDHPITFRDVLTHVKVFVSSDEVDYFIFNSSDEKEVPLVLNVTAQRI